jgi:hypothetical protein
VGRLLTYPSGEYLPDLARPEASMFERTVSFWRRLTRSRPRRPGGPESAEDRRVWVRFPADLETTYHPAGQEGRPGFAALVRNISVGGLSLAVDRPFEPGALLTVELPGPAGQATYAALACVVHCGPEKDGRWVLGCTFSRELSDDDLEPFGARRARPQPADQRTWVRYTCDVQASFQLVAAADGPRPAKVLNISASGVRLLVREPIEAGTLLSVALRSADGTGGKTMLSCVVHVSPQGEGEWGLGCNFITELSEADLLALL